MLPVFVPHVDKCCRLVTWKSFPISIFFRKSCCKFERFCCDFVGVAQIWAEHDETHWKCFSTFSTPPCLPALWPSQIPWCSCVCWQISEKALRERTVVLWRLKRAQCPISTSGLLCLLTASDRLRPPFPASNTPSNGLRPGWGSVSFHL